MATKTTRPQPKTLRLIYRGDGVFTTRQRPPIPKGHALRIRLRSVQDDPVLRTRGLIRVSPRVAREIIDGDAFDLYGE